MNSFLLVQAAKIREPNQTKIEAIKYNRNRIFKSNLLHFYSHYTNPVGFRMKSEIFTWIADKFIPKQWGETEREFAVAVSSGSTPSKTRNRILVQVTLLLFWVLVFGLCLFTKREPLFRRKWFTSPYFLAFC